MVIDQNIDTSTPTGKLMFNMLAAIAEFETELRKERQLEDIAKTKKNGVKFGAKAKLTEAMIARMKTERNAGVLIFKYRISKTGFWRL